MNPLHNLQHQLRCKPKLKYAKLQENQIKPNQNWIKLETNQICKSVLISSANKAAFYHHPGQGFFPLLN